MNIGIMRSRQVTVDILYQHKDTIHSYSGTFHHISHYKVAAGFLNRLKAQTLVFK